ncbi:hypothetical protein NW768_010424 [Fusarium equiseti]|uniref:SUN domain-containing protein n=1 Tax=Fusarium equiseti TaxID=61235 RepID=A0ABQ8R1E9_FUSEQ|nr:hypothetical protein NW768_010424 [Fusarium equiseti]
MPPRVARRSTRVSSREPEPVTTREPQNTLVRPQLPTLEGTPSSRRQYTYGSGVEPPPRVGAGLQRMDLSNAVNQALTRGGDQEEEFARPAIPRSATTRSEQETTTRNNASGQTTTGGNARLAVAIRDDDSSRSFGLESDYYDHATIESAPTNPSQASQRSRTVRRQNSETRENATDKVDPQPSRRREQLNATAQPSDSRIESRSESRSAVQLAPSVTVQTLKIRHDRTTDGRPVNTPAPDKTRQNTWQQQTQLSEEIPDSEDEKDSESDEEPIAAVRRRRGQPTKNTGLPSLGIQEPPSQIDKLKDRRPNGRKNLFGTTPTSSSWTSTFETARQNGNGSQERDWDIQKELLDAEARETRTTTMNSRRNREEQTEDSEAEWERNLDEYGRWRFWFWTNFGWLTSIWPFNLWNRPQPPRFIFDDDEYNQDGPTEYIRLLYPMTYVHSLKWAFDGSMDRIISFIDRLRGIQVGRMRNTTAERLVWLLALSCFTFFLLIGTGAMRYVPDIGSMARDIHLPSPSDFSVPNIIPSISWPSWGKSDDDDNPFDDPWSAIDKTINPDNNKKAEAPKKKKKPTNIHKEALKGLEKDLPPVVQVDIVDGNGVIKPEFYHALIDRLKVDGSFLNFEEKNGNYEMSSEKHWKSIVARFGKDPTLKGKLDDMVNHSVDEKLPNLWDTWFRNNNDAIEPLIEKAMAKNQIAGSGAAFDQKLIKIVNEELSKQNQTVVSRAEFLEHLQRDLEKHESKVEAEFTRLRADMEDHIKESIRTAQMMAPQAMSSTDIERLIRKIMHQTYTDGSLEAFAKSNIHAHWNSQLKYQVNYFGTGAGATVESVYSSPTWDPWYGDKKEAEKQGLAGIFARPPIEALRHWQDEGDRWCGAHGRDNQGRPQGVILSIELGHEVIPENIVVEHIHPNATVDPDARPKRIEVFARYDDRQEEEQVRVYSLNKFPDNNDGEVAASLPDRFVKISQFTYLGDELNDGVHVHRINDELSSLGYATDHVILRAMSNYGAKDHTCFYRVRLFGKVADK